MKNRKKGIFFIALCMAIILTVIVRIFDISIIKFISQLRNSFLDYLFLSVAFASNVFIIFVCFFISLRLIKKLNSTL